MPSSAHLFPTSGALTDRPAPHLQPLPQGGHSVAVSTAASLAPQTTPLRVEENLLGGKDGVVSGQVCRKPRILL